MVALALRLALTPCTVLLATLVQRRLGPALGGRVVGLPLTTGPFLLLLSLGPGPGGAAHAAAGVVAGQLSVVGFCVAYGQLADGRRPWVALTGALAGAAAGTGISALIPMTGLLVVLVLATIAVGLLTWPTVDGPPPPARAERLWETPVRMAVSGTLVACLLGLAQVLGPHLAGLLSTMPVLLTVLASATHRGDGPAAAIALVRGALASMPASVLFVAVLAGTLVPLGTGGAFGLALGALVVTDLAVSTATGLRRRRSTPVLVRRGSMPATLRRSHAGGRTARSATRAPAPPRRAETMVSAR